MAFIISVSSPACPTLAVLNKLRSWRELGLLHYGGFLPSKKSRTVTSNEEIGNPERRWNWY